jgi:hypothetical protein
MARVKGMILRNTNYEVTAKKPLDARSLVKTYEDLLLESNWLDSSNKSIAYNGMLVAVANTDDTSKNGLYFLFDVNCTSFLKSPDVTKEENWTKIGETSEINNFIDRLSDIESALSSFDSRLLALEKDKVVIRRDNEYNYKKRTEPISNNEICIVDVPGYGIRVKIGNGDNLFTDLPYLDESILKNIDNLIVKGYFYQDAFYTDDTYTEQLLAITGRIYIDSASSKLYTYNGITYEPQKTSLPNATAEVAGVVKLYDQMGLNTDGTMTQRAITNEINGINEEVNEKFEMLIDETDSEMLVFGKDLF